MRRRERIGALAAAAALALVCAGAALAAGGDENDPLVTLSYLNQAVIPQLTAQAEQGAASRQAELAKQFEEQLAQYRKDAEALSGGGGDSASFTLLTLSKGQAVKPEVGCELLLRVGTMTVTADGNPALIDVSTGGTLNRGSALEKNHLYMATIAGRSVQATAATVKVLVRGGYAVG